MESALKPLEGPWSPGATEPRPAQLVLEVVNQLQKMFNPDMRMIKKRIEDLISREFLERDAVRSVPSLCL